MQGKERQTLRAQETLVARVPIQEHINLHQIQMMIILKKTLTIRWLQLLFRREGTKIQLSKKVSTKIHY